MLKYLKKYVTPIVSIMLLAVTVISGIYVGGVFYSVGSVEKRIEQSERMPEFTLSKDGKNVVVIMLDRAMGEYLPYIFNEMPELCRMYSGFSAYTNVASFGGNTNFSTPSLFGGYEYTPWEINKRTEESLKDKHNEALLVLPTLFGKNGYKCSIIDPPYANYEETPDISIYDGVENTDAYLLDGRYAVIDAEADTWELFKKSNLRNFFCYGIFKSSPVLFRNVLYDSGRYFRSDASETGESSFGTALLKQTRYDASHSDGISKSFSDRYRDLTHLEDMTRITEGGQNTYMTLTNNMTHDPNLLKEPEYVPSVKVDNEEYDKAHKDRFTYEGVTLRMNSGWQMAHYHTNVLAYRTIGEWLEFLKSEGVYDNTRIILVSDHGYYLWHRFYDTELSKADVDIDNYKPILLVKDFGAKGDLVLNDEFMTLADVPSIALDGLIEDPENPFTHKKIDTSGKDGDAIYVFNSEQYFSIRKNNGNTFIPDRWIRLSNKNVNDPENWTIVAENATYPVEN